MERVPAFAPFLDGELIDLFGDGDSARDLAVNRLISQAAEFWTRGNLDETIRLTQTVERYLTMTDEQFEKESE